MFTPVKEVQGSFRVNRFIFFHIALAVLMLGLIQSWTAQAGGKNPLQRTYNAHGGLERWNEMSQMSYVMEGFPLTPQVAEKSISTVDLNTRNNKIETSGLETGLLGSIPCSRATFA